MHHKITSRVNQKEANFRSVFLHILDTHRRIFKSNLRTTVAKKCTKIIIQQERRAHRCFICKATLQWTGSKQASITTLFSERKEKTNRPNRFYSFTVLEQANH